MLNNHETHSGYVAILGRPNVGKSTLLNQIIGQKISITSRKPQTTRHRILGIKTSSNVQMIYVDTPGMHQAEKQAINRYMNKSARGALRGVDAVIFLVEHTRWFPDDEHVFQLLVKTEIPIILVINKVDKIAEKEILLPYIESLTSKHNFHAIVPISARKGTGLAALQSTVESLMPPGPFYFPSEQVTDKSLHFQISEIIREKLTRLLSQELPYALTVEIESFEKEEKIYRIMAIIWVERSSQRPIILGTGGERIKEISRRARIAMENLLGRKVFLRLMIKVRDSWSNNVRALKSLGFNDIEGDF